MPYKGNKRDIDAQSGKRRVSKKPVKPAESDVEDTPIESSESEEEEVNIPRKSESRRKAPAPRKQRTAPQKDKRVVEPEEREDDEVDERKEKTQELTSSAGFAFAIAASLRVGLSIAEYHDYSAYVPSCRTLFNAAEMIAETIHENDRLHDFFAAYTSTAFYLYISYCFYFQIFRVREDRGILTKGERRALRALQNVGAPEQWLIPTPLIPFFYSLGACRPSGFYGWIVPQLPVLTTLNEGEYFGYQKARSVSGLARIPLVPGYIAQLRYIRSASEDELFADDRDYIYPLQDPVLSTTNTFLGLSSSAANAPEFLSIAFSVGWKKPIESQGSLGNKNIANKIRIMKRWNIPDTSRAKLGSEEEYLQLKEDASKNLWIKNLLSIGSTVCRFFPGSVSLAHIPLVNTTEMHSKVTLSRSAAPTAVKDVWYQGGDDLKLELQGFINNETSGSLYKVATTTEPRTIFSATAYPLHTSTVFNATEAGPVFSGSQQPLILVEAENQPDPSLSFRGLIEGSLYDHLAGEAGR